MKGKLLAILGAVSLAASVTSLTSCDDGNTIRVGLHLNLGAGAGYSLIAQGYAEEEGITISESLGEGPTLAASLVAGHLDISYMGNGVAWNYFSENSAITMVALDALTDDDRLIAYKGGKGGNLTIDSDWSDLIDALKGSTVGLDLDRTPITFFRSLLTVLNDTVTDGNYLWYQTNEGVNYPTFESESDYKSENQITIVHSSNTNIAVGAQQGEYDFVVAFSPVSTQLESDTDNFVTVARTSTHMKEDVLPSTWAVNTAWKEANPDLFYSFMRALVKGMNYRAADPAASADDVETVSNGQVLAEDCDTDTAIWLSAEDHIELRDDGSTEQYLQNIRNSHVDSTNFADGEVMRTIEEAVDFSVLYEICETYVNS